MLAVITFRKKLNGFPLAIPIKLACATFTRAVID